jgi:hypothetical protein
MIDNICFQMFVLLYFSLDQVNYQERFHWKLGVSSIYKRCKWIAHERLFIEIRFDFRCYFFRRLSSNQLTGEIPAEIGNLIHLQTLYVNITEEIIYCWNWFSYLFLQRFIVKSTYKGDSRRNWKSHQYSRDVSEYHLRDNLWKLKLIFFFISSEIYLQINLQEWFQRKLEISSIYKRCKWRDYRRRDYLLKLKLISFLFLQKVVLKSTYRRDSTRNWKSHQFKKFVREYHRRDYLLKFKT